MNLPVAEVDLQAFAGTLLYQVERESQAGTGVITHAWRAYE